MTITIKDAVSASYLQDLTSIYDMDKGPLAIPNHIRIGRNGELHRPIKTYDDQVNEYRAWLINEIRTKNRHVMTALDVIYNRAISGGIVLATVCMPSPWITHAHIVKQQIEELAGCQTTKE